MKRAAKIYINLMYLSTDGIGTPLEALFYDFLSYEKHLKIAIIILQTKILENA